MKELAFLMFFVGCAFALIKLLTRFFAPQIRHIYFYIPSQMTFNILWGFIFYVGFGILTTHTFWMKVGLIAFLTILTIYLIYLYGLSRHFKNPHNTYYNNLLNKKLQKQRQTDEAFNTPYTADEALKILGLSAAAINNKSLIETRLVLLEKLSAHSTETTALKEIQFRIKQALPVK